MQIDVFDKTEGLHGTPEVWVRVLANTVTDWPTIQSRLSDSQKEMLRGSSMRPSGYHPHLVSDEERKADGHTYAFEDWFILPIPVAISVRP